ncbi:CC_3452 family protein [Geopsychrobacter electrodiphilus]|uniref:CC_3452 family protein n=1 Tax=Geopsychrobacter electrodiphilus TaxID=225196 RepID=UPI00037F55E8|nr:hypothetical protein [Geopsychrobacter electrodiphilus]
MVILIQRTIKKTVWKLLPPGLLLFVLSPILPGGMAAAAKTLNPALYQNQNIGNLSGNQVRPLVHDYVAVTSHRSHQQGKVNVFGTLWICSDARCTTSASWARPTVEACNALARSVGAIHSYGGRGVSLNKKDINRCNANISMRKKPIRVKEKLSDRVATPQTSALSKKIGVVPKSRTGKDRSSSQQIVPRVENDLTNRKIISNAGTYAAFPKLKDGKVSGPKQQNTNLYSNKSAWAPKAPLSFGVPARPTESNHKNQVGRGLATERAVGRVSRMVISPQPLEMTGLDEDRTASRLRMVTTMQPLEMTGPDVEMATGGARAVTPSSGSRTVLSMQVLEMTGLETGSNAVRSRTVISTQVLEMTGR